MLLDFEERKSDSPFIERIWRCHSTFAGPFISIAMSHWEMVVTRFAGKTFFTVRGPETRATLVQCPAGGEWLGIRFKLGAWMPHLPASSLLDGSVNLPGGACSSFWLDGSTWPVPTYENADMFVERLVHEGLLVREPVVETALREDRGEFSLRSVQRHFLYSTGLTRHSVRQIERARQAALLLQRGSSALDVAYDLGYFDQAHLIRSLKRFIGQTPAQLADPDRRLQLSFLYNTDAPS